MAVEIIQQVRTELTLDFRGVTPVKVVKLNESDIRRIPIGIGNRRVELGELFNVCNSKAKASQPAIRLVGDYSKARNVGREMCGGNLKVQGNVGSCLGAQMSGGAITCSGSAGDYVGSQMSGGTIRVQGNVGAFE